MMKTLLYYAGITTLSALAIAAVIYVFNRLFLFSHLSGFFSPSDVLFCEGLVILILGILIVSGSPHSVVTHGRRRLFMGSGGLTIDNVRKRTRNILVFGLALIMTAVILLLLYSQGIW